LAEANLHLKDISSCKTVFEYFQQVRLPDSTRFQVREETNSLALGDLLEEVAKKVSAEKVTVVYIYIYIYIYSSSEIKEQSDRNSNLPKKCKRCCKIMYPGGGGARRRSGRKKWLHRRRSNSGGQRVWRSGR
jgi:hypothetical protein